MTASSVFHKSLAHSLGRRPSFGLRVPSHAPPFSVATSCAAARGGARRGAPGWRVSPTREPTTRKHCRLRPKGGRRARRPLTGTRSLCSLTSGFPRKPRLLYQSRVFSECKIKPDCLSENCWVGLSDWYMLTTNNIPSC